MQYLTDQYFTYRETQTTENGTGTLVDIKGQTLKWNQFCCKGRYFTRGNNEWQNTYTENGVTFTYFDDYTVRIAGTPTARTYIYLNRLDDSANYPVKQGEKLLLRCSNAPNGIDIFSSLYLDNTWKGAGPQKSNKYVTVPSDVNKLVCMGIDVQASLVGQTIDVTVSLNVFNLTKMFGSGNEPTEEEFNALFPIYYPYNSGSLIPFMGNGLKTVGFNQWDEKWEAGILNNDGSTSSSSNRIITSYVPILPNITYSMTIPYNGRGRGAFYDENKHLIEYFGDFPVSGRNDVFPRDGLISSAGNNYYFSFIPPAGTAFVRYNSIPAYGATYENNICINISDSSKNGTYEPYTESVVNLPISTYFPSGMKQAGDVYDELTPTKATARMRGVDLGTLTFNQSSNFYYRQNSQDLGIKADAVVSFIAEDSNITSVYYYSNSGQFRVYVNDISIAPSGMLYYELETPIETPISPELDLTFNIDKGGTEELLPTNTSTPTTTPILCDIKYGIRVGIYTHPNPEQGGVTSGDGMYYIGDTATVTATPNEHYAFESWVLDGEIVSTDPEYTFEVKDE